ncbi:MAG: hypothetical protein AB8B74_11480 [Crocinitomicaceae bacterium]
MFKYILFLITSLSIYTSQSQSNWNELTGKQKAFFYQLTRKVENLKPEVFHLFEFTDSIPYVNDTLPDFPFVEREIEADSSKLLCHFSEMARKKRGILMDIGTHYASWELDLLLQFRKSEKPKYQYLKEKAIVFEKLVLENAPSASAKMWSDGQYTLTPKITSYFSPNLTIIEKIAALKNSNYNADEKLTLLNAIYKAQSSYISIRAAEIVLILTNQSLPTQNFLIAAGDGKNWNDLESVIRTKYNRPLPDPKAFFSYDLINKRIGKTDSKTISVNQNSVVRMSTRANLSTHLHTDVWAYHPLRQTTLIIQKGGNSYVLYGNNKNRYLSPDPEFEEGVTYSSLIEELEEVWIADLKEKIYGKRGYDYLIDLYEKKIVKTRFKIKKTEQRLDEIRYKPEGPPKMKKKKKSKKQRKKGQSVSYQDNQGLPRGKLSGNAKKRQIEQHNLVGYESQFQAEQSTLRQLKKDKEEAFDLLAKYEAKLDIMKKNYGYNLMTYTNDKFGNYRFNDGTTFNFQSQDLTFPTNSEDEYFEVILVSFGENVMDKNYEEVFVHLNLNHTSRQDVYTLLHHGNSPSPIKPCSVSDSIQIQELFWHLKNKKLPNQVIAMAESGSNLTDTILRTYIENRITLDNQTNIALVAISNQFKPIQSKQLNDLINKHPRLKVNELAAAIELNRYYDNWKTELIKLANEWIKDSKSQKIIVKSIKRLKLDSINVGGTLIKI